METLLSKELLSEVLSKEFNFMFGISDVSTYNNLVQISFYETELCSMCGLHQINIYELAFLIRDYFHKKYKHDLDMSLEINEIFKNATQFYESLL